VTINQAPLTITASDQSKVYGTTTGTLVLGSGQLGFTSSGLVNSESIGSVTLAATSAATSNATTVQTLVGALTPSSATGGSFTASNYTITYDPGNVMITAAPLTITAIDQSRTYGPTGGTLVLVRG